MAFNVLDSITVHSLSGHGSSEILSIELEIKSEHLLLSVIYHPPGTPTVYKVQDHFMTAICLSRNTPLDHCTQPNIAMSSSPVTLMSTSQTSILHLLQSY